MIILLSVGWSSAIIPNEELGEQAKFIRNDGQWDERVDFKLALSGSSVFLEQDRITYALLDPEVLDHIYGHHHSDAEEHLPEMIDAHAFQVVFENALVPKQILGQDQFPDYHNYYIGDEESKWKSNVPAFHSIVYKDLYQGIDLHYYTGDEYLKYDFIVAPGADPSMIQMLYAGVDGVELIGGQLHIQTSVNKLIELAPIAYQIIDGKDVRIPCEFVLEGSEVHFNFPNGYDPDEVLVIDPVLIFSSYTGSTANNFGFTATYDLQGNLYGGGIVFSLGYPTTTGAFSTSYSGLVDIGISKFNSAGNNLIFSTYLGGIDSECPNSLVVDDNNDLVVLGVSASSNFPTTSGAYDELFNGGIPANYPSNGTNFSSGTDIVVSKFNPAGSSLLGSTFVGGSGNDGINSNTSGSTILHYNYGDQFRGEVITDATGNIYVASCSRSTDFPTSPNAIQTAIKGAQDGVCFRLSPNLDALVWSTYLGGSDLDAAYSVKLDAAGDVYVCGGTASNDFPTSSTALHPSYNGGSADGFLIHITSTGTNFLHSTYLGTTGYEQGYFVEIDGDGDVYAVGQTTGNYPVSSGVYSNPGSAQFIHKLDPNLSTTIFSTVFGSGSNNVVNISPTAFLVDVCEKIYVAGWGGAVNSQGNTNGMTVTADAFQSTTDGSDFYFIVLEQDASSLLYATYFGGFGSQEHVDGGTSRFDKNGIIYEAVCAGCQNNSLFPSTPGAWSETNGSTGCNLGVIKFEFELASTGVVVTVAPDTSGCVPLTVDFVPTGNLSTYLWDFGDGDTAISGAVSHTFTQVGTYTVTAIAVDSNTCSGIILTDTAISTIVVRDDSIASDFNVQVVSSCDSFAVDFVNTSLNGAQFIWDFGDGLGSTAINPSHTYTNPGTYTVQLIAINTNSCNRVDTSYQTIDLNPQLIAAISAGDTTGCLPLDVNFGSTGTGGQNFYWDFGDGFNSTIANPSHTFNDTGIFTVTLIVTDTNFCNPIDTAIVQVEVSTTDFVLADFALIELVRNCDSLIVDLTYQGTNGVPFMWDLGDGTMTSVLNPQHLYTDTGRFDIILSVTDSNSCNIRDTALAQISFFPEVVAAFARGENGCVPLVVDFEGNSNLPGDYLWDFGDGTSSTDESTQHAYPSAGIYPISFTVIDSGSCNILDIAYDTVIVSPQPIADYSTDTTVYSLFELIDFNNLSIDASSYLWDFGDGSMSAEVDPSHAYEEEGSYLVCLTAGSDTACIDSICRVIDVIFLGVVDVPNAFSPNGDGVNDQIFVEGSGMDYMLFRIYNRWGELVFESTALDEAGVPTEGWDGIYKGVDQEMEVYVYTLEASFFDSEDIIIKKGNISLLR